MQSGAGELARRIAALSVKRRWSVPWARWKAPAAHRLLARLRGFVEVAASEVNGVPALITSSGDGIHTIDLQTNEVRALRAGTGPRDMGGPVAGAGSPERPLATVCRGNRIEVWDLGASSLPICIFDAHSDEVRAVIAARLGNRDVVASGSKDGTVLVWDIVARQPIARFANTKRWVFSLAVAKRSGRDVILAGYFGGEIIAWDPLTGERVGEPLESRIKPDFAIYRHRAWRDRREAGDRHGRERWRNSSTGSGNR